jgi:hypothetical protein
MLFRLICGAFAESVGNSASEFRGRVGFPPYPGSLLTADRNGSQLARVGHATWPDADE